MAKNKVSEWSSTPANNTDIGGINIAEGCAPSGINNAIRELMAQVKDMQAGTDADNFTVGGNLVVNGTATITSGSITGITDLSIADGGTGASTAANARINLGTVADTASNGIAVRTSANTLTARSISSGSGISVSDGDGVSGNPTISNSGVLSVDSQTGAISLSSLAAFASSLSTNGYQKLPSGLIIQWGTTGSIAGGSTVSVTLPISFPNAHLASVATCASPPAIATITGRTTTTVDIRSSNGSTTSATWVAIGY